MEPVHEQSDVIEPGALLAQARAEIDGQVATAKRYPRNLDRVLEEAMKAACHSVEIAQSMWYSVPRDGKYINGPSVRLAEIMLSTWGNLRAATRVIGEDDKTITAQAAVHDLEKNVAIQIETKRRITTKQNRRFSDDLVITTGNAARSIALRDAIFRVIPRVYVEQILANARKTAAGDAKTFADQCAKMVDYFTKLGISAERVCGAVGRIAVKDLTFDDLDTLRGIATAVREGTATLDAAFPKIEKDENQDANAKLKEKLGAKGENKPAADAPKPGPDGKGETIAAEAGKPKPDSKRTGDTKPAATKAEKPKAAAVAPTGGQISDADINLDEAADIDRAARADAEGDEDLGFEN